jgi:hypothetical protein
MFRRREIEERLHARENLLLIHLLQNKKKKTPKTKIPDPCTAPKTHTHRPKQTKEQCQRSPQKEKQRRPNNANAIFFNQQTSPTQIFNKNKTYNKSTTRILLVPVSFSFPV